MINVTKPFLPGITDLNKYIEIIFNSEQLTNNGTLVQKLESKLESYLGVKNLILVSNGTLALQLAYKALGLKGHVITTPFSFVATVSSLVWEGLIPNFIDIDSTSLNIDLYNINKNITKKCSAIVPVHVFGNPCDVNQINIISRQFKLPVIYDASHAFGVKINDESILNWGDISTLSFHATKIFHTIEGGAIIVKDDLLYEKLKKMINFGYHHGNIECLGINAKMNEFQAAMGLCILKNIDFIFEARKKSWNYYFDTLSSHLNLPQLKRIGSNNYHYFPIIFPDQKSLHAVQKHLTSNNIFARQYFSPSLDTLNYITTARPCLTSRDIASRILCLPLYVGITINQQDFIIDTIIKNINIHSKHTMQAELAI